MALQSTAEAEQECEEPGDDLRFVAPDGSAPNVGTAAAVDKKPSSLQG